MKPKSYETVFKEMAAPPPDPEARVLAKRAALAEFARANAGASAPAVPKKGFFQGLLGRVRLSDDSQSHGKEVMNWNAKSRMFAAAAGICVAVLGFAVIWPMVRNGDSRQLLEKPPATLTPEPVRSETDRAEAPLSNAGATIAPAATAEQKLAPRAVPKPAARGAPTTEQKDKDRELKELTVAAGFRDELRRQLEEKKQEGANEPIVTADIGKFPDQNASEALQRLPAAAKQPATPAVGPDAARPSGRRRSTLAPSPLCLAPPRRRRLPGRR